jgi:hypothetical protein
VSPLRPCRRSLLAANFGIPQDAIDKLPKKERGILGES